MSDAVQPTKSRRWFRRFGLFVLCFALGLGASLLYNHRDEVSATICMLDNEPTSPAPHFAYVDDGTRNHAYFVEEMKLTRHDGGPLNLNGLTKLDLQEYVTYDIIAVGIHNPDLELFKFIVSAKRADEQHPERCRLNRY